MYEVLDVDLDESFVKALQYSRKRELFLNAGEERQKFLGAIAMVPSVENPQFCWIY